MTHLRQTITSHLETTLTARLPAVAAAMLIGLFLLYGVSLAQPMAIHNAAHDARHAFVFPCH